MRRTNAKTDRRRIQIWDKYEYGTTSFYHWSVPLKIIKSSEILIFTRHARPSYLPNSFCNVLDATCDVMTARETENYSHMLVTKTTPTIEILALPMLAPRISWAHVSP